ncbi:MAG: enoyl-CoA hydratase/isomerase family protein [Syntrophomonadaceae bacterium]|nr:enoyl-CoA hydratase/isomerase family protein [Syntrophomonadaceae bacterium]
MSDVYAAYDQREAKGWVENGVGFLQLNRPKAMNALSKDLLDAGRELVKLFTKDPEVKAIVVMGNEKVFGAGGDIKAMAKDEEGVIKAEDDIWHVNDFFFTLQDCPKPVVAAVRGLALGGGLELLLACDVNVIAEDATLAFPEINLGIFPGGGGTQRAPRYVGMGNAKYYILTGEFFSAAEAHRIGIANVVVPADQVVERATKLARKIGGKSPQAVKAAKHQINVALDHDLKSGCAGEQISWSRLFGTKDQQEGMIAFLENRKPNFTGE